MNTATSAVYRLSPLQEAAFRIQRAKGKLCSQIALEVDRQVSGERLQQAIGVIAERHETLRTRFINKEGFQLPFQSVSNSPDFTWSTTSVTQNSLQALLVAEQELCEHKLRALLATSANDNSVLVLTAPGTLADSSSMLVIARQLLGELAGREFTEDILQYPDVAEWQHGLLEADDELANEARSFWAQQSGQPTSLPFRQSETGSISEASVELSAKAVSPEDAVEAAITSMFVLAHRLAGEAKPRIVELFSGRTVAELANAVGLFARTLSMSVSVGGNSSFDEVRKQVQQARTLAHEYADYLPPMPEPADGLVFEYLDTSEVDAPRVVGLVSAQRTAQLKLELVREASGRLSAQFYSGRLSSSTVQQLAEAFARIFDHAVSGRVRRVPDFAVVSENEEHRLIHDLNATDAPFSRDACLHQLIERQAAATPERSALVGGDVAMSYAEMNAAANRLAHHLIAQGIRRGYLVGVCFERSAQMIVALLAVMKSGAAYVPITPDTPSLRAKQQLEGAFAVLTLSSLSQSLPSSSRLIFLDDEGLDLSTLSDENPSCSVQPEDIAYVLFTSGSTGTPKGVEVRHRNLVNYAEFICDRLRLSDVPSGLNFATVSTLAADLGNTCIFPALISGGCLHVVPYEVSMDGARFGDYSRKHEIDVLKIVPSHLKTLLSASGGVLPRRFLICGGEMLTWSLVEKIREANVHCEIMNHYGPTETTVGSFTFRLADDPEYGNRIEGAVPIGRPIANTHFYVVDPQLSLLPAGIPGELLIAGAGVSAGYRGQPETTTARFLASPFVAGETLYRTGDRVRLLEDGNVEFLGRADNQVKIRGFRVELGEIEAAIRDCEGVAEAVALAPTDEQTGERRLIAFYVEKAQASVSPSVVTDSLRTRLPEQMIPAVLRRLDRLPLNANGKVDMPQLLLLAEKAGDDKDFVAPATPMQELLAGIWEEVLRKERVSADDNFFDLGGHSLLATQLCARVRKMLRLDLPLRYVFEFPVLSQLAARVEVIQREQNGAVARPIVAVDRSAPLPLSFAQQRLWFFEQLHPGTTTYSRPWAHRISGLLQIEKLRAALQTVLDRHEVLRTTFTVVASEPTQVVHPCGKELPFKSVDISTVPADEKDLALRQAISAEIAMPFDLEAGPLFRAMCVRLSAEEHVLVVNLHHIVTDGWSMSNLAREIGAAYAANTTGQAPDLPPLRIQYADFAAWQRECFDGEGLQEDLTYWLKELADAPPLLKLATDRPRNPVPQFKGGKVQKTLNVASSRLKEIARSQGATPFMVLMGLFATLLHRYTGEDDIVIGTPVAGRSNADMEPLIGFFINNLALRLDFAGNPNLSEMVGRVRDKALAAYAHQDLPFEKLVEEIAPERDLAHQPVFQVVFSTTQEERESLKLKDLQVEAVPISRNVAKMDLAWTAEVNGESVSVTAEYDSDLFEQATIERMLGHYERLAVAFTENPQLTVGTVPILTDAEEHQLRVEWNSTAHDYPAESSYQQLFEEQVRKTPDAVAVIDADTSLTYAELNAGANRLAHYLTDQGVCKGDRVVTFLPRDCGMVAAFLGILKSGAAFVPIDPSYPSERIRMTLEEAQPVVVVTVEAFASSVPSANVPLVKLDTAASTIMAQSGEDAVNASSPDDCAYIIFTSGSTGRPKGVEVLHRGLVNMATQMCRELQLGTEDTCAAVASVAFDACIVEIFGGLIAGSRIAVGEANLPANGEAFADFLERYDVTYLAVTPTSWTLLLEAGYAAPRARRFSVAEPLSRDLLRRLLEAAPGTPVFNGYGPTENTVWATTNIIRSAEQAISIGRPIANVNLYIVDRYGNLCPIGVPGEVHLGGVQVARGYLNRPELTAEKFIADRFSNTPGGRLYRTGDIGRFLPDGNVELFGRQDNQVKIRGFRIELGDVEQAIMHHPDVADCAVIARSDAANEKFLAAYLVAKNQKPLDLPAVRERIAQQLPSFMVPSGWLQLQRLPLTPGGKVDRKALPAPDLLDNKAEGATEQLSQTQELIAGIWAALLRVQNIGSNDDFFRLGGHSLLATRAIAETRKIFGIDIPLRAIFEESTLAAFARAVERQLSNGASQLEPISVVDRSVPLPLSSSQRRIWFLQQLEPTGGSYNVPYTSRLKGRLNVEALSESITELIARHESLRTSFVTLEENTPRQVVHQAASCKLEVRDLSSVDVDQQDRRLYALLEQEATRPFDLALAPLVRAVLVRLGEAEHILCLVFHHIVVDGWSIGLLSRELSLCYNARLKHEQSALAPLPVQYVDFAVWQSKRMDADDLARQSTYWKEHLKGAPAAIELVSDRPRPAVLTFHGAKHSDTLPAETLASVRELAVAQGATMYMVLLAAFNVLLSRYSGQDDIVVGSPVAGRGAPGTENIVGLFINTLALRTRLVDQPSFSDLVSQVRRTVLNGLANQDLPFEKLVEEINPVRDTSRSPLFQVMFAVQEADAASLTLDDIDASPVYVNRHSAKFDILLSVSEHAGVLRSTFEYNTDLFDAETIARFAQHWRTLVAELAANPRISTGAVEFLSGEELHEMLVEWNGTQERLPELSIHRYFERQVARTPAAIAVRCSGQEITYAELNGRANAIAHGLRSIGVNPGDRVALLVERSPSLLTTLLAILKCGAVYVALDREFPVARLKLILDDSEAKVLITAASGTDFEVPDHVVSRSVEQLAQGQSKKNLERDGSLDDAAYISYTSGSTGRPKGVLVPHRGVIRLVHAPNFAPLDQDQVIAQFAPVAFDASTLEIWGALLKGGICAVYVGSTPTAVDYGRFVRESGVTLVFLTTSLFNTFIDDDPSALSSLQWLLTGGEAVSIPHVTKATDALHTTKLVNVYGPTENTTFTTYHGIEPSSDGHSAFIPIGKPISNTKVYVLDHNQRPVPIGVPGELYTTGDGLALGYVNNPQATAERFVCLDCCNGERAYRTGDIVRWLPTGELDFLGRVDDQVKIRGFRIELGEVEAELRRGSGVAQAIVAVQDQPVQGKRLIAFIVAEAPATFEVRDLLERLRRVLPGYMVPTRIELVSEIPLSATGKADRKALLSKLDTSPTAQQRAETENTIEELVASIWSDVLGVVCGADSDFFAEGGHSLLATQVVSRTRQVFGCELTVKAIFEAPTVRLFSKQVEAGLRQAEQQALRPIAPSQNLQDRPLSFAQQRLWFLERLHPDQAIYNMPWTRRIRGPLHASALRAALSDIVRRHEVLRTVIHLVRDEPVQVVLPHTEFEVSVLDRIGLGEEARDAVSQSFALEQAAKPFDLERGPMLRASLLRFAEDDHALVLSMHHIVTDQWSYSILTRELEELYQSHLEKRPPRLPELPIQYADYASWQRQLITLPEFRAHLDYWRQELDGASEILALPTDHPRSQGARGWASLHRQQLSPEFNARLQQYCRAQSVTPFMAMLAAYYSVLSHVTKQQDIVLGTDFANRTQVELEKLIGFFVNVLPIRLNSSGERSFGDLLKAVRETTLNAHAHQEVPFDMLVQELRPERTADHNPIVQSLFVMQNAPDDTAQFAGLTMSPVPSSTRARFDLSVFVRQVDGLRVTWVFDPTLFEGRTIHRLSKLYQHVLESVIVAGKELTLGEIWVTLTNFEADLRMSNEQQLEQRSRDRLRGALRGRAKTSTP